MEEAWRVAGTYFEACNCDAVCPCRRQGGRAGGRSTYGVCDFALSWWIESGSAGETALDAVRFSATVAIRLVGAGLCACPSRG